MSYGKLFSIFTLCCSILAVPSLLIMKIILTWSNDISFTYRLTITLFKRKRRNRIWKKHNWENIILIFWKHWPLGCLDAVACGCYIQQCLKFTARRRSSTVLSPSFHPREPVSKQRRDRPQQPPNQALRKNEGFNEMLKEHVLSFYLRRKDRNIWEKSTQSGNNSICGRLTSAHGVDLCVMILCYKKELLCIFFSSSRES